MKIEQMEQKYKVRIRDDSYFDPWSGKLVKRYKVYDASGTCWEKGLNYNSLRKELATNKGYYAKVAEDEARRLLAYLKGDIDTRDKVFMLDAAVFGHVITREQAEAMATRYC